MKLLLVFLCLLPFVASATINGTLTELAALNVETTSTCATSAMTALSTSTLLVIQNWGQCGGRGGDCAQFGDNNCRDRPFDGYRCRTGAGWNCQRQNGWYWQCLQGPPSSPRPPRSPSPTATLPLYSQCGGKGANCGRLGEPCVDSAWTTPCVAGSTCKRQNEYYWQCLK